MVGGRRINASAGDELPAWLTGGGIEGVNRVTIDRGDEDTARRNGRLRQFAPERDFPFSNRRETLASRFEPLRFASAR